MILKITKPYIQNLENLKEIRKKYFKQEKEEDLEERFVNKPSDIFYRALLLKKESEQFIKEEKILFTNKEYRLAKSIELIVPDLKFELEIENASLKLHRLREEYNSVDISEEIWDYTKTLLRKVSKKFREKDNKKIPIPKFNFIEESTEIRWIKDEFKLVLSLTDYIDDIVVYVRTRKGQYFSEPVPKNKIVKWVLFWLDRF